MRFDLHVRDGLLLLIGSGLIKCIGRSIKLKLIKWHKVKRERERGKKK